MKNKLIWLIHAVSLIIAVLLIFFQLNYLAVLLAFILAVDIALMAGIFSDFRKGRELWNAEEEKKNRQITEFDKITRQLVKRDLELARANQRLGELDSAKSDFVSVAAHQLRTPLTGIKWSYTTLLDNSTGPLNDDQKQIIENGLSTINHTIELVNDLLNVAHIEEGKFEFHFKKQPLLPIIKEALARVKMVSNEKKITLSEKLPASALPDMDLDSEKIALAIENLLDNAVKYTPAGGKIDFSVTQEQGLIRIVVQDSGIGIPKDQKSRLFTKFFRAKNAVSIQTSGTGLGLYMVKKIIDRHGGKIAVESNEGKGSAFIVTIPEKTAKKS